MTTDLLPHQVAAIEAADELGRVFLNYKPGTGKTRIALELLRRDGGLYVSTAGNMPVFHQQRDEWWPEGSPLTLTFHGVPKYQQSVFSSAKSLREGSGGTLVADEAHRLKGRKTTWTKSFERLGKRADRLVLMTGTPTPKSALDHFMYLQLLFPGDRRFTSYWRWVETHFHMVPDHFQGRKIGGMRTDPVEFMEQYADRWLSADVEKDLPPLRFQVIECDMTPKQRTHYQQLRKTLVTEIGDVELAYFHPGSQWAKLLQLTTGLQVVDPAVKASGKLPVLESILSDRSEMATVVFCSYRSTAALLAQEFGGRALHGGMPMSERRATAEAFQRGEFPVLVGTYAAAAEGWTLHRADTVVRVEPPIRVSDKIQSGKRIHRLGQDKPCLVIDLVCPKSVDADIRAKVAAAEVETEALNRL